MIGGTNMNIYIAEMVAKRRRELNMTQEELASRICISAQAVSNWERMESYPDITMLPILSSILEISVDDLLGIGRETDEQIREKWVADMQEKPEARKTTVLRYYHEYPKCYHLMEGLMWWIYRCQKDDPALHVAAIDMAKRILAECTKTDIRLSAAKVLSFLCDDDEAGKYIDIFGTDIRIKPNIIARRAYDCGDMSKAHTYFDLEQFWVFMYFCTRSAYCEGESEKGIQYYTLRENMILSVGNGTVPDGLLGTFFMLKLFHSAALFSLDKNDSGYEMLEGAVAAYEKWCAFDKQKKLSVGKLSLFGNITIRKISVSGQQASAVYVGDDLFGTWGCGVSMCQDTEQLQKMFLSVLEEEKYKKLIARAIQAEKDAM